MEQRKHHFLGRCFEDSVEELTSNLEPERLCIILKECDIKKETLDIKVIHIKHVGVTNCFHKMIHGLNTEG